jgi:hypothetical protein
MKTQAGPLCIEHWRMVEEVLVRKQEANIQQQETALRMALEAEMQMAQAIPNAGMFSVALAKAEALKRVGVVNIANSLTVTDSVVGAINSGTIERLNVRIGDLKKKPETTEVGKALQELKDAILQSKDMPDSSKQEAADQLSYLAEQAAQPEEQRQPGVIKATANTLSRVLSVTADVLAVWNQWGPVVVAYFAAHMR